MTTDDVDVAAVARVEISSEEELYPIDNVFDGQRGPGGSCWVAAHAGTQLVTLRFVAPIAIRSIVIESEERGDTRTQQIGVGFSVVGAGGESFFEAGVRTFRFTPYGPSFHRATWIIDARAVASVSCLVTPIPEGRHASLTSIVIRA